MLRRVAQARGLAKIPQRERRAEEAEEGRAESRPAMSPPLHEERAERRSNDDAEARRGREPPEPARAILRIAGVGDVGLQHADRSTPHSLHESRAEEQPERGREAE